MVRYYVTKNAVEMETIYKVNRGVILVMKGTKGNILKDHMMGLRQSKVVNMSGGLGRLYYFGQFMLTKLLSRDTGG